jgi:uncharacterized protein (TIGR02145 family)
MSSKVLGLVLLTLASFNSLGYLMIRYPNELVTELSYDVKATTVPLSEIPVGKVVSVNGMKFVKVGENKYQAVCGEMACANVEHCAACNLSAGNACSQCEYGYVLSGNTCVVCAADELFVGGSCVKPAGTMQSWNSCTSLPTPVVIIGIKASYFTQGPVLTDSRDGKLYEIRKFPDGKCWMVDNLAYGGSTDECGGKTDYTGQSNKSGSAWGYGDCRDANASSFAPCNGGDKKCGYLYSWQAAVQLASAYYNNSVSYPSGVPTTTNYLQGICPTGWHLPSGGSTDTTSELVKLDRAVGGTEANCQKGTNYTVFWKPTVATSVTSSDPWKSIYAGDTAYGSVNSGSSGYWWSSTEYDSNAYYLFMGGSLDQFCVQSNIRKYNGNAVRCIKD